MGDKCDILDLCEEKFTNFVRAYRSDLALIEGALAEEGQKFSFEKASFREDIYPQLVFALETGSLAGINPVELVAERDLRLLLGFVELERPKLADVMRTCVNAMRDEHRDKLWRYFKFFLDAADEKRRA